MVRAVTAAAAASKRPVVAVVMGGSAVDLAELKVRGPIKLSTDLPDKTINCVSG